MDYYAGLDVSLRSCALCIVDDKGIARLERELPCKIEAIAEAFTRIPNPVVRIGFEVGTMSHHHYFGSPSVDWSACCGVAAREAVCRPRCRMHPRPGPSRCRHVCRRRSPPDRSPDGRSFDRCRHGDAVRSPRLSQACSCRFCPRASGAGSGMSLWLCPDVSSFSVFL
jgi:hypothetical protein